MAELAGICIEPRYHDRESVKAAEAACHWGLEVISSDNPDPERYVPIGGVGYCEKVLGYSPVPDYYPHWLTPARKRQIWRYDNWYPASLAGLFIKDASRYKAYEPRVWRWEDDVAPSRPFYASEVVNFHQEWRYYVANGCVVAEGWYDGIDDDEPAPKLNCEFPDDWCGAADFGRLASGEIALVECQHPYACGWYGDDHGSFLMWLLLGWEYMLKLRSEHATRDWTA